MTRSCTIRRSGKDVEIQYRKQGQDPWEVKTPEDDEFWDFAMSTVSSRTVEQLIRKKWCSLYNPDPDPLTDRG